MVYFIIIVCTSKGLVLAHLETKKLYVFLEWLCYIGNFLYILKSEQKVNIKGTADPSNKRQLMKHDIEVPACIHKY